MPLAPVYNPRIKFDLPWATVWLEPAAGHCDYRFSAGFLDGSAKAAGKRRLEI